VRDRLTVDDLLAEARATLSRLEPEAAHAALAGGAVMVDVRGEGQRAADGEVPGAIPIARNVLEWRCDPACAHRDQRIGGHETLLIVLCDEGFQSSLAAANLQRLGFRRATDVSGGFQAWRAAGLPVRYAAGQG
jgi:rhodanese-related sulfurtransferase